MPTQMGLAWCTDLAQGVKKSWQLGWGFWCMLYLWVGNGNNVGVLFVLVQPVAVVGARYIVVGVGISSSIGYSCSKCTLMFLKGIGVMFQLCKG